MLVCVAAAAVYSNIHDAPFVFDDTYHLVDRALAGQGGGSSAGASLNARRLVDLTFRLNHRLGGFEVFGYHLVNVIVHVMSGVVAYFLASAILSLLPASGNVTRTTSLFAALIFVAHPVQTQAVTYTIQRYASMAAMFYMASVLFYLRARVAQTGTPRRKAAALYTLAAVFGLCAQLSKESAASLPAAILLVEWLFVDHRLAAWKRKWPPAVLIGLGWLCVVLWSAGVLGVGMNEGAATEQLADITRRTADVSRGQYLCTQFSVLVTYLRLLVLPRGLNVDPYHPWSAGFLDGYTPAAFLLLVVLAVAGITQAGKRPVLSFFVFWFFVTLSIESSVFPLRNAMFEHRLYLPMFGFALAFAWIVTRAAQSRPHLAAVCLALIVFGLGSATYARNDIWRDEIKLWTDSVSKNPANPRARSNLGAALVKSERKGEAIARYSEALGLDPVFWEARYNLAMLMLDDGRTNDALAHCALAMEAAAGDTGPVLHRIKGHSTAATAMRERGLLQCAEELFREALRVDPRHWEAHYNLANVLVDLDRRDEARQHYLEAIRINPGHARSHNNLANLLKSQGEESKAVSHYYAALVTDPNHAPSHYNLANLLAGKGASGLARKHYLETARIDPGHAKARNNLGVLLAAEGDAAGAMKQYLEAIKLEPEMMVTYYNVACLHAKKGEAVKAVQWLKRAAARGFDDWALLPQDEDFAPIRDSREFARLIEGR